MQKRRGFASVSWRRHAIGWLLGGMLLAACGSASASPSSNDIQTTPDAVTKFLKERGLVGGADNTIGASPVAQNVRDGASELVMSAMNFLGVPYKRGGTSADNGFDCSGFTRHVFEMSVGMVLPRRANEQAKQADLQDVKNDELKPGDLVFFNTMRRAFSHVGIYIGNGKFIHSPRVGGEVRIEDMREAYWTKRFNGARRAALSADNKPAAAPAPATTETPAPEVR